VSIIKIFDENFSVKIVATKLESVQSKYDASSANCLIKGTSTPSSCICPRECASNFYFILFLFLFLFLASSYELLTLLIWISLFSTSGETTCNRLLC
jgi:hypothetical protein